VWLFMSSVWGVWRGIALSPSSCFSCANVHSAVMQCLFPHGEQLSCVLARYVLLGFCAVGSIMFLGIRLWMYYGCTIVSKFITHGVQLFCVA
jgi:hypothetical protein